MLRGILFVLGLLLYTPFSFAQALPCIAFEASTYKFDEVSEARGQVSHSFKFVNSGAKPLVIFKGTVNCNCTKISFDKRPVLAGDSSVVVVSFDPKGEKLGRFVKNIQIFSNATNRREILTIIGEVVE